jgi:hypothetical protein
MSKLRLISSNQVVERPNLGEAWVRAVVQWQIVGLYAIAAGLEHWLQYWNRD